MIKFYPFGHEVFVDGELVSIVTDKVVAINPPENVPLINDLKKYIETGSFTRELRKLFETNPGIVITYHFDKAFIRRMKIERKIEKYGRKFYLISPIDHTYELPNPPHGQRVVYNSTSKTLSVIENDFILYVHTETPLNFYGRKILESLFTNKLKKTLEPMFPFREKMIISVQSHNIIAHPEDRKYRIVVEDNDFIVYDGQKPIFKYIYRCGKRITKYGFNPEKVPCMKKL